METEEGQQELLVEEIEEVGPKSWKGWKGMKELVY